MIERIGVYRVEGRLGRGGMGEVLLAWDDRLERRVAIKRIRQDAGLSPEQRERFRREARLAARLNHPAVVQIHDLVTEGADDAIVMEYVEGETLAVRLKSGPLALDEALRLGHEIAEGLEAAHEAGLIHRDLKAANVIVTKGRRAKILDFGLARPVIHAPNEEPITRHGMVMGTFHAMSPEQARGEDLDERSDLFSLGALLYEMLTGRAPFRGNDAIDSLRRVVQEPPADPRSLRPDLPAEVAALLDRLLAKDRRDRPAGAGEVVAILERLRPVSGSTPSFERDTVSDLPTAPARAAGAVPALVRAEAAAPLSTTSLSLKRHWLLLTLPLLGVLLVLFVRYRAPGGPPIPVSIPQTAPAGDQSRTPERLPIRVYMHVLEPARLANDEPLAFAASAIQAAGWGVLSSLQGISPIDPTFVRDASAPPQELVRETAAKELLLVKVVREEGMGRVYLRRTQDDGTILYTDDFRVSLAPDERSMLADAVAVNLPKIYPDHAPRPGTPELDVRDEDFASYTRVWRDLNAGRTLLAPVLSELEEIVQNSPRFLDARLLAAQVAISRFQSTRDLNLLTQARAHIREAHDLAPNDPRPIVVKLRADRTENKLQDAEAALEELGRLLPGDPEVLVQKAHLREHQGRLDEAVVAMRTAADQAPAWQTLLWLAQLEAKTGNVEGARRRFDEILGQKPGDPWTLEALGNMEMLYGNLQEAERIYTELAQGNARFSHLTSLGLVHSLRRQHHQASEAYGSALKLAPDNPDALLNLADTLLDLGQKAKAEALYHKALQKISEQRAAIDLPPREAMTKALCLARLGKNRDAVDLTHWALRESPDDAHIHLLAAQVFSLVGERNSAVSSILAASSRGIQPGWFKLSAFDSLRDEPELRSLMNPSHGP